MSVIDDRAADVRSLAQFTHDPLPFLQQVKDTGRPIVLEEDGAPALVLQDPAEYERMLEKIDRMEAAEGIREGLADMQCGQSVPLDEAFQTIRDKRRPATRP